MEHSKGKTSLLFEPTQRQILTNDCLVIIIHQFRYDRPGLLSLLTVSRLFFQEALMLLMDDFLSPPNAPFGHRSVKPKAWTQLYALFIRSLLLRQCLERQRRAQLYQQQGVGQTDQDQIGLTALELCDTVFLSEVSTILTECGLVDVSRSSLPLFNKNCGVLKKTTIDYAIYFTRIQMRKLREISLDDLLKLPSDIDSRIDKRARLPVLGKETTDKHGSNRIKLTEASHGTSSQTPYNTGLFAYEGITQNLYQRVAWMSLSFNHHHIVHLEFDPYEAPLFVPFATKLYQLQSLHLSKYKRSDLIEHDISQVISFIQQNQNAFPSKPCLDVTHSRLWSFSDVIQPIGSEVNRASRLEARKRFLNSCETLIQMYETVGKPRVMDVENIPHFYERSDRIHVEDLQEFTDRDNCRFIAGEGPAMESFLKRCYGLKSLELVAGDPSMFRWAIPSPNTQPASRFLPVQPIQRHLARLEKLTLRSHFIQPVLLHALSDAAIAFGGTLREVCCRGLERSWGDSLFSLDESGLMLSELRRPSRVITACADWHLPNVRRIYIELQEMVELGSFDGCPLLEELTISQSRVWIDVPILSENPFTLEENKALMPVWKLPRLRILSLSGKSMARFNFESLRSMKRLMYLSINMRYCEDEIFANIYTGLYPLPLQQAYDMMVRTRARDKVTVPESHTQDTFESPVLLPWDWGSDSLVDLRLSGPTVAAFHLDLFRRLPKLHNLSLDVQIYNKYALSTSKAEAMAKIYSQRTINLEPLDYQEQPTLNQDTSSSWPMNLYFVEDQGAFHSQFRSTQPFVLSQLKELNFSTHWKYLTPDILLYLLAWLTPNLTSLRMEFSGYCANENILFPMLFKAIEAADKIVASGGTSRATFVGNDWPTESALKATDVSNIDPFGPKVKPRTNHSRRKPVVGRHSENQGDGSSTSVTEPRSHPASSGSRLGLPLTSVKVDTRIYGRPLNELGFREIKKKMVKSYREQGIRVYELCDYKSLHREAYFIQL